MAHFTLNRNHTHRSTLGRVINFVKDEPVYVPPELHKEVAAIGATRADGEKTEILDAEKEVAKQYTPDERRTELFLAFAKLAGRQARGDFTGQGIPSIPALKKLIEFEPEKREVEELWREFSTGEDQ